MTNSNDFILNLLEILNSIPIPKMIPFTLQGYNLAREEDKKEFNRLPEHIRNIGVKGILPKSKQT